MREHGQVKFSVQENIIVVHAYGPFNEEASNKIAVEYQKVVSEQQGNEFYIIEVWDEHTLGAPEVFETVAQFWANLENLNCKGLALVFSIGVHKMIANNIIPKIGKSFENEEQALEWINSLKSN